MDIIGLSSTAVI